MEEYQCPHCGNTHITKKGTRNNKQRIYCPACEKWSSLEIINYIEEFGDELQPSIPEPDGDFTVEEINESTQHIEDSIKLCPNCGSAHLNEHGFTYSSINGRVQSYKCRTCNNKTINPILSTDVDIIKENVRISKNRQKVLDTTRIERKSFREYARVENVVEELNKKMIELLERESLSDFTIYHDTAEDADVGIIQISDTHFGELVNLKSNQYNWEVAAKRLKKLVTKARKHFLASGVNTVLVAFAGDLQNSDRRLDEMLTNSENRTETTFLAVYVLEQMLLDINQDFNVIVASVTGNESRVKDEMMWSLVTDNYDYTIHNMLKFILRDNQGITFVEGGWDEKVVQVGNKHILLMHGHSLKQSALDKQIQNIKGKYAAQNIIIDFVLFGHIHCANISDTFARNSSLVGNNAYSEKGLNIAGRASQNIHILSGDDIDSMKVDLQDISNVEYGYALKTEYENYKEVELELNNATIFKVVI